MSRFVMNAWYAAAWDDEIGDAFLRRKILGSNLLLFRTQDGTIAALRDRCPHRFAPLSRGTREGDAVRCGYHGLKFDSRGVCIDAPFSKEVPPHCSVRAFPVTVKDRIVWVWMGPPELADLKWIPDLGFLNGPEHGGAMLHVNADYRMLIDNLMDPSHIEYVHKGSIGGDGAIQQATHHVTRAEDGTITGTSWMANILPPGPAKLYLPADQRVDHWLTMKWFAPAIITIEVGFTAAGGSTGQPLKKPTLSVHLLTPETDRSTHYFYSYTNLPGRSDGGEQLRRAFEGEDRPMIEAAFEEMGGEDFWDLRPVVLKPDSAAVFVRRRLAQLQRSEGTIAT